mmetsp:Transcript_57108/g.170210  ORF Transcript_57108/g.170210 Transcript_57108/m.170210 type:complete len:264 (-) Transcript_57108:472-1263(-)
MRRDGGRGENWRRPSRGRRRRRRFRHLAAAATTTEEAPAAGRLSGSPPLPQPSRFRRSMRGRPAVPLGTHGRRRAIPRRVRSSRDRGRRSRSQVAIDRLRTGVVGRRLLRLRILLPASPDIAPPAGTVQIDRQISSRFGIRSSGRGVELLDPPRRLRQERMRPPDGIGAGRGGLSSPPGVETRGDGVVPRIVLPSFRPGERYDPYEGQPRFSNRDRGSVRSRVDDAGDEGRSQPTEGGDVMCFWGFRVLALGVCARRYCTRPS